MYYYAHLNENNIVVAISSNSKEVHNIPNNNVAIDSYDEDLIGKTWNGSEFI